MLPAALGSHTELPAVSPVLLSGTDRPRPGSPRLRGEFGSQCRHPAMKRAPGGRCISGRCHTGPEDRGRRDRLCPRPWLPAGFTDPRPLREQLWVQPQRDRGGSRAMSGSFIEPP
ncbi:unnamed protein product [Coccothraustes coccothraustes]